MQMEKKITTKEDGRFLVYYHFPDTATEEETQVFEGIEGDKGQGTGNSNAPTPNTQHPTPNTGGVTNV